jgi:HK97 family phage major capsid protein
VSEKLTDIVGRLDELGKKNSELFQKGIDNLTADEVAEIRKNNDEMTELGKQKDELTEMKAIEEKTREQQAVQPHPGFPTNGRKKEQEAEEEIPTPKSIAKQMVETAAIKDRIKNLPFELANVNMKTLLDTATGWVPYDFRSGKYVDYPTRALRVVDLINTTTTNAASISYMELTTFTNAAVEVTEGSAKPEATLAWTERNDPVRKIAVWIPATDEQLADVPRIRGIIENLLGLMVRLRLDSQILVGDGTAPNLSGILDRPTIQSQAKGADPTPDAVYKAMTLIRTVEFAEPNGVVFHPNDWQAIRLLRTADGIYIWGNPADAGPERIWGLPIVQTTAMTENTALVGDFNMAELAIRQGVTVEVSNSHDDYFVKNLLAIRCEMRAALAVYRPPAFCKVTGI